MSRSRSVTRRRCVTRSLPALACGSRTIPASGSRNDRTASPHSPPVASKRCVGGFCAAIRRIPATTLAAVVFAALASSAFAHGWIDERAATTGRTGAWSEAVAYDPATQTAELEGDVVFTPKAVSAGNFVTLKFATTLAKMPEEKSPGADAQAALRIGSNGVFQVWARRRINSDYSDRLTNVRQDQNLRSVSGASDQSELNASVHCEWIDVAASGVAPVSGAEYGITFVFDYAAGKYSVSIMDAKGVWQLLQSAAGMNAFPIATKAKEVKDITVRQ